MIPMTSARIFRKCLVYSLAFFLTAAGSAGMAAQPLVKEDKNIALPGNVKLELVKVEAGSFEMSAADGENESDEVPHRATLTKDFYLAQTEVTQAQWKAVMGANPSEFKGDDLPVEHVSWNDAMSFCEKLNSSGKAPNWWKFTLTKDFYLAQTEVTQAQWKAVMGANPSEFKGDDLPVEHVSWNDAMSFCEKLNSSGKAPNGWKFTLPTETQWEYAARGGKKSKGCKYSGSNTLDEVAWYEENSDVSDGDRATSASSTTISPPSDSSVGGKTHPVGRKKANELGLYDMSGNVYEWCLDDWQAKSGKLTAEFTRGNDSAGSDRTVRGGSFFSRASFCRAARRGSRAPGVRHGNVGFRPALVPESY